MITRQLVTFCVLLTFIPLFLGGQETSTSSTAAVPKLVPPQNDSVSQPPKSNPSSLQNLPQASEDGYWIESAPLNEVFQYLARRAGLQFFHNNELTSPEYMVTGHIQIDDPRKQMEELAIVYGVSVYEQGSTISLVTEQQQMKLPVEVMSYPLKYLRGSPLTKSSAAPADPNAGTSPGGSTSGVADFEKLKSIIKPLLTKEVGIIEFEEKTNTLLITDNKVKLQRVTALLEQLDRPKQQIMVNVRVLRVKRSGGRQTGVDWSNALGDLGTSVNITQSLNALFNLPNTSTITKAGRAEAVVSTISKTYTGGSGLVFDPIKAQAIVRALEEADLVSQEACPTIITEDNEQGVISIVDRFPIITSNIAQTTAGQTINEEVRYKIDEDDPDASDKPEKSREIGVTLAVTPTLLPDGTVRMKLRPRVAKIVELISGRGTSNIASNSYPRVSESTVEAISRIPSGQSLFLGGFYDYSDSNGSNRVPVLSAIPLVNKLFRSNSKQMEQVSLVFIITPSVYDAGETSEVMGVNDRMKQVTEFPNDSLLPPPEWQNENEDLPQQREASSSGWLRKIFSKKPKESVTPAKAAAR